jgi:hypothetical protein
MDGVLLVSVVASTVAPLPAASLGVVVKAPLTAVFVLPNAEVIADPMVAN